MQSNYLLLLSSVENGTQLIDVSSNDLSDLERRDARSHIFLVDVHVITLILLDLQRQDNTRGGAFFYGSATSLVKVRGPVSQKISQHKMLMCELFSVANLIVTSAKVVSNYVFTLTFCLSPVCLLAEYR